MQIPQSTDILIVGAGPSGLALAVALQKLGVFALQIDRQTAGANTSRACVVHARTLEVLEPLGVVPQMIAHSVKVPVFRVRDRDRTLLEVDFSSLPSAYPFTSMCPQNVTESILLDRLESLGGAVVRHAELVSARIGSDGGEATVNAGGAARTIRTKWRVGCDGSHSIVRELAGIAFEGGAYAEDFVLGDVRMDWPLDRSEVTLFFSPNGFAVVAPLPDERFRIVATVTDAPEHPSLDYFQALMNARGPTSGTTRINEVVWSSRFWIQHRVAANTFSGRTLLCGDAAHVHSPAGGQGMNTGIQDAVALAKPLVRALQTGDEADLRRWADKRRQIAEGVVEMTDRMTKGANLKNSAARVARNAALSFVGHLPRVANRIARKLSELGNR